METAMFFLLTYLAIGAAVIFLDRDVSVSVKGRLLMLVTWPLWVALFAGLWLVDRLGFRNH